MIRKFCIGILLLLAIPQAMMAQSGVASVQFFFDGVACSGLLPPPATGNIFTSQCNFPAGVTDGVHTLTAKATDKAGNVGTSMAVSIIVDNTVPTLSITSPAPNSFVGGNRVQINASAADTSTIAKLELKIDGVLKTTVPGPVLAYSWNTNPYKRTTPRIEVTAYDKAGKIASQNLQVTVR